MLRGKGTILRRYAGRRRNVIVRLALLNWLDLLDGHWSRGGQGFVSIDFQRLEQFPRLGKHMQRGYRLLHLDHQIGLVD